MADVRLEVGLVRSCVGGLVRTRNPRYDRAADTVLGRTSPGRAGSRGITVSDATTSAHPSVEVRFVGASVTEEDDGIAIVTIGSGAGATPTPTGAASVTVTSTAGTSTIITVPASVVDGDVMILALWKDDDPGTVPVTATGWTQIGADNRFTYFFRVADGEPASYTATWTGSRRAIGVIVGIDSIDTDNPIASFAYGEPPDPPYVSAVELSLPTGDYYLLAGIETNRGDVDFTAPSGWTLLAEGETGGTGADSAHTAAALAGKAFTGSTATSPVTFGSDIGDLQANAQIALRVSNSLTNHIVDPTDAHGASAVSVEDSAGYFTGTNVETALTEVLLRHSGGLDTISAHGNAGTTETINPAAGNVHTLTLDASCTITLTAPPSGFGSTIEIHATQDGTGGRVITWPGSVTWVGSSTPDSTAAGTAAIYVLQTLNGGTAWTGAIVGAGASALDDLSDVAITSAAVGDVLRYNGSAWVNTAGVVGELLISDTPAGTPLVFADLIQNEAEDDLVYADL